jgi:hypothetical protein
VVGGRYGAEEQCRAEPSSAGACCHAPRGAEDQVALSGIWWSALG